MRYEFSVTTNCFNFCYILVLCVNLKILNNYYLHTVICNYVSVKPSVKSRSIVVYYYCQDPKLQRVYLKWCVFAKILLYF